jgi:hypothetical protein
MPRSSRNPVDVVLAYFETADPVAADVTLYMAKRLLKLRITNLSAVPLTVTTAPASVPKPRRKRGPNKPKPPVAVPLPLPTPVAQG